MKQFIAEAENLIKGVDFEIPTSNGTNGSLLNGIEQELRKAAANIGDIHHWKSGPYQKVAKGKWMPVKRVNGKWEKDEKRDEMEESGPESAHLQDDEVKKPKTKGRPAAKEGLVRVTPSQGKIITVDGKVHKLREEHQDWERHYKPTKEELEPYRARAKKLADRAAARAERKKQTAEPTEAKTEPEEKPKKRGRGKPPAELNLVTERKGYKGRMEKWVKIEDDKAAVRYKGNVAVGEKISDEEAASIKTQPKGKRGRKSDTPGLIVKRSHGIVMKLGDLTGDGRSNEITYQGSLSEGDSASEDELNAYREMYRNKQGVKKSRAALFEFVPREREFVRPRQRRLKRRNPFSPPDLKPNRGEVDPNERRLKNGAYLDSGVNLVKGSIEHLPKTNYMSDDLNASLLSHQRDFVNQSMDAFQERKMKTMLNFDGTGAGKTFQQLALAETFIENTYNDKTMKPVFIVTQSDRIITNAFLKDAKSMKIQTNVPANLDEVRPGINIVTYSSLHKFQEIARKSDLVLFDEAHKMKGTGTRSAELGMSIARQAKHSAMFTATPLDKNEHLLYLANGTNLDESKLLTRFGYKPKEGKDGKVAWNFNQKLSAQQTADNIERINQLMGVLEGEGLLVRREKSLSNLDYRKVTVDMDKEAWEEDAAAYHRAKDIEIEARQVPAYALGGKWAQKLRSVLENRKINAALSTIESEVKEGRKVVYFGTRASDSLVKVYEGDATQQKIANLTTDGKVVETGVDTDDEGNERAYKSYKQTESTIKRIEEGLKERGISFVTLSSADEDSRNKRKADQKIKDFQEGDAQVFITTPQSGGTGLNLDDTVGNAPRTAVIHTPPFSGTDMTQMLGRILRLSTQSKSRAIMLTSETATDDWNTGINDQKMERLGAAVGGDVAQKLNPRILELVSEMTEDEAASFYEQLQENPEIANLKPSEDVTPFEANDFVASSNEMTGRAFGMNDVDILKEYDMFTESDVEKSHTTDSQFSAPGAGPTHLQTKDGKNKSRTLPVDDRVNWALSVGKDSSIGRVIVSRALNRPPEVPQFYVVVGKDSKNAYAKPVSRTVDNSQAMRTMVEQRYGFLGKNAIDKFMEGLSKDVGIKKSRRLRKARKVNGISVGADNGNNYIENPSMMRLSDQLMLSLIGSGKPEDVAKLYAPNKLDFLGEVYN